MSLSSPLRERMPAGQERGKMFAINSPALDLFFFSYNGLCDAFGLYKWGDTCYEKE